MHVCVRELYFELQHIVSPSEFSLDNTAIQYARIL